MGRVLHKIEFAGPGADSGLFAVAIPDFARNTELDATGKTVEKTTWNPGDVYHFLVQHDERLRITDVRASSGAVQALGAAARTHGGERLQIEQDDAGQELSYIPSGDVSVRWYGNAPALARDGRAIGYASGPLPAIGDASYPARWHGYRLVPPPMQLGPEDEWPVLIVVYLDSVE